MNRAIRIVVATMGVTLAISGLTHGFFEILQGNKATDGLIIDAISESLKTWEYGGEAAFTLIPNFLITGIAAILVSLAIIIWSVGFLHRKHGATVFLLLFVLLLLVGGGIGQVVFFTVAWALATRINKPLTWWRRVLPEGTRHALAGLWPYTLVVAALLFIAALEIAVLGYVPGVDDADQIMNVVLALLGGGLLVFLLSFVSAVSHDIEQPTRLTPAMTT